MKDIDWSNVGMCIEDLEFDADKTLENPNTAHFGDGVAVWHNDGRPVKPVIKPKPAKEKYSSVRKAMWVVASLISVGTVIVSFMLSNA